MASVAELKKSFFTEIDKVEDREDLEKLLPALPRIVPNVSTRALCGLKSSASDRNRETAAWLTRALPSALGPADAGLVNSFRALPSQAAPASLYRLFTVSKSTPLKMRGHWWDAMHMDSIYASRVPARIL